MHPVPGHRAGRGVGQVLEERSDPLETMACDGLVGVFETRNAMVAWRCSPTPCASMPSRCSSGMSRSRSARAQSGSSGLGASACGSGLRRRRKPPSKGAPTTRAGIRSASRGADLDLAGLCVGLTLQGDRDVGSGQQEPRWTRGARRRGTRPGAPRWRCRAAPIPVALLHRLGDNCPHGVRGPAGPAGVSLAREQDEEHVAAEIDDVATLRRAGADHGVEAPVEDVRQLLRAAPAHGREPLGEAREPRDVGGYEGPGHHTSRLVGPRGDPLPARRDT